MKKYLPGLFLALTLLFSCGQEESAEQADQPDPRSVEISPTQYDLSHLGSSECSQPDTSLADHTIWELCSSVWAHTFSYVNGLDNSFILSIDADSLSDYIQECESEVKGLRAYFVLTQSLTEENLDTSLLHIALIPFGIENGQFTDLYEGMGDTPYLLIGGDQPIRIDSSTASGYAQNWVHYDTLNNAYAPVWAYNYAMVTVDSIIAKAQENSPDNQVHFVLGMRTVGANNPFYCAPSNTPFNEQGKEGFLVFTSVLATKQRKSNNLIHNKDFARPCPKFCGGGLVSTD